MGCGSSSDAVLPGEVVTESVVKSAASQEHSKVQAKARPVAVQIDAVEELNGSLAQSPRRGRSSSANGREDDMDEVNRLLELPTEDLKYVVQLQLCEKPAQQPLRAATKQESMSPSKKFTAVLEMPTQVMEMPSQIISPGQNKTLFRDVQQEQQQQLELGEAEAPDPWASMANQYQLRESIDLKPSISCRNPSGQGAFSKSGRSSGSRKVADPIIEYDEERGGLRPTNGLGGNTAKLRQGARKQLPPISGPKTGGWGQGSMAMAGTLMLGDEDEILQGKPQVAAVAARQTDDDLDLDIDFAASARAKPASNVVEDLGMEEIEDVDALLASEMEHQGLTKDLAAKLRQFEAMQDDD